MVVMHQLEPSKETENKLRWSTHIEEDNTDFFLYIPKWRVPEPWPGIIQVSIEAFNGDPDKFEASPPVPERPIRVLVKFTSNCTGTVRFTPVGDQKEWQTGEPYIPLSLIPKNSGYLILTVQWVINSKGHFKNVPTWRSESF